MINDLRKAPHGNMNACRRAESRIQGMSATFDSKRNSVVSDNFDLDINFYSIADYDRYSSHLQLLPCQQALRARRCKPVM
jgi:hypothetical protein